MSLLQRPQLRLTVTDGLPDGLPTRLSNGPADVVLTGYSVDGPEGQRFCVDHSWASPTDVLSQLAHCPWCELARDKASVRGLVRFLELQQRLVSGK